MSSRGPSLTEVIDLALRAHSLGLRVALPARVERYEVAKQRADVKPLLKLREANGTVSSLPVIRRVPVVFPGGGGFRVIFPLVPGDTVELLINDQAIDAWKERGAEQDPGMVRMHDLSDAVAIPGMKSFAAVWGDAPSASMKLGKDGGSAQIELKDAEIVLAGGTHRAAGVGHLTENGTLAGTTPPGGGPVTFTYIGPDGVPGTPGLSVSLVGKISTGNAAVLV